MLLVSLFRVDEDAPPPSAALLSKSSQTVKIDRFQESSVADFLRTCFHWPADDGVASNLASFLWTETQGSPFYLRSLVTTMVRERVIAFSFDLLRWTVDFTSLQLHTSEGVDAYLDRTLSALPENVQQLLRVSWRARCRHDPSQHSRNDSADRSRLLSFFSRSFLVLVAAGAGVSAFGRVPDRFARGAGRL